MDPWIWWALAAAALVVLEVAASGTLVFAMIAVGAATAAVVSAAGAGPAWSIASFAIVSLASLLGIRPLARRHRRQPAAVRTGVAALVGSSAVVIEPVTERDGRIKLAGEVWSARSLDADAQYDQGHTVWVIEIDGATAVVTD